jgi:hypothetical protein
MIKNNDTYDKYYHDDQDQWFTVESRLGTISRLQIIPSKYVLSR